MKKFIKKHHKAGIALGIALFSAAAMSQSTFEIPTITVPGAPADSNDPAGSVQAVVRYGGSIIAWFLVIASGFILIKSILKSWNKTRRDDDGKWGEVIAEAGAGSVICILVIVCAALVIGWLG